MGSYQKFTLSFFRKRLQEGAYENATGANRAIGKTRELSDSEKDSARTLVRKFFGDSEPTAKKKPAAKKAAKKAPSKPVKKLVKKADKKAAKKEAKVAKAVKKIVQRATKKAEGKVAVAARGKSKKAAKKAAPPAAVAEEPAPAAPARKSSPATKEQQASRLLELMGSVVTTLSVAMKSMESAKDLFPKADLEAGVSSAHLSMAKAVRIIDSALTPMDSTPGKAPAVAGKSGKGAAPKKAPAVQEEAAEEDADEETSP